MHPDFELLTASWTLAVQADGYAPNTLQTYRKAVASLAVWLADHHPDVGPAELEREHVRGWLVHVRQAASASTARAWFSGVRHFTRWLVAEGEAEVDATAGIKQPRPDEPHTPVLSAVELRR